MKKYYLILISTICLLISSCKTDNNNSLVTSDEIEYMKMSWSKVEPKFQKYIENDRDLSERDKLTLQNHAKLITKTLNK